MKQRRWLLAAGLLFALCLLGLRGTRFARAQAGQSLLAFVNSAGQLIASSADGAYRWIVTNPGETLAALPLAWSPDDQRLFFAVDQGMEASLRVGDRNSQSAIEIGRAAAPLTGGQWTGDGRGVLVGTAGRTVFYPADGSGPQEVGAGQLVSASDDGQFLFTWQPGGSYALQPVGGQPVALPGANDLAALQSGLWADAAPLVAYWAYEGNSMLAVANAASGETVVLDSGRTAPINPVAWRPGTTELVYRDGSNVVRIADLACLLNGCADNPLATGAELLPASASSIDVGANRVAYVDSGNVHALDLNCVDTGTCMTSSVVLGNEAAPGAALMSAGGVVVYEGSTDGGYSITDVRAVPYDCGTSCSPTTVANAATAGPLSPDGQFLLLEGLNGGLSIVQLANNQTLTLDPAGVGLAERARWS